MNISLASLTVAHVLSGPYLTMVSMSQRSTLSVGGSHFARFFSNCLFSSAALRLNVQRSVFSHFQSFAISLSRALNFTGEHERVEIQTQSNNLEPVTFTECSFDGCSDAEFGGAIFTFGYLVSIDSCGFFNCTAGKNGGAIAVGRGWEGHETTWPWIGSWGDLDTLPGVEINKTCFSQCFVTGERSGEYDNENDKLGFVLYTHAIQVGLFDFSAIDCSRSGAQHASVFFAWSQDVLTEHGNISVGSKFVGEDVSAFRFMYAGSQQSQDKLPGSYTGIPAVNHRYHHTDGFKSKHVYWAHIAEGRCSHVLDYVDVTNTKLIDDGAIFYAYWVEPTSGTSGNQLQVKNCNVFKVVTGQNTKLYDCSDKEKIESKIENCKTDVQVWAEAGKVTVTQIYTPNKLVMENEQYCIFPDPASDAYSSESGDLDSSSDPDNTEDAPNVGTGTGSKDSPFAPEAIAGIVIGILLLIALIILLIFFLIWRRKRIFSSENSKEENVTDVATETTTTQTGADAGIVTANSNQTQLNQNFDSAMLEDDAEEAS